MGTGVAFERFRSRCVSVGVETKQYIYIYIYVRSHFGSRSPAENVSQLVSNPLFLRESPLRGRVHLRAACANTPSPPRTRRCGQLPGGRGRRVKRRRPGRPRRRVPPGAPRRPTRRPRPARPLLPGRRPGLPLSLPPGADCATTARRRASRWCCQRLPRRLKRRRSELPLLGPRTAGRACPSGPSAACSRQLTRRLKPRGRQWACSCTPELRSPSAAGCPSPCPGHLANASLASPTA